MHCEQHHYKCFSVLGQLARPKMHEIDEGRVVVLVPVDLFWLLCDGSLGIFCHELSMNLLCNRTIIYRYIYNSKENY